MNCSSVDFCRTRRNCSTIAIVKKNGHAYQPSLETTHSSDLWEYDLELARCIRSPCGFQSLGTRCLNASGVRSGKPAPLRNAIWTVFAFALPGQERAGSTSTHLRLVVRMYHNRAANLHASTIPPTGAYRSHSPLPPSCIPTREIHMLIISLRVFDGEIITVLPNPTRRHREIN